MMTSPQNVHAGTEIKTYAEMLKQVNKPKGYVNRYRGRGQSRTGRAKNHRVMTGRGGRGGRIITNRDQRKNIDVVTYTPRNFESLTQGQNQDEEETVD